MSNDKEFDEWFTDYFGDELSKEVVDGLIEDTSALWKHQQKIIDKKDGEIERLKKDNEAIKEKMKSYCLCNSIPVSVGEICYVCKDLKELGERDAN